MTILEKSEKPAVLVDVLDQRYGAMDDVREFLKITGFPVSRAISRTFHCAGYDFCAT